MTASNSASVRLIVLPLALCLKIALTFLCGWYFQSSLVDVKEQQQELKLSVVEMKTQRQETVKTVQQLRDTRHIYNLLKCNYNLQK